MRRTPLSRDRVLQAALALADRDGLQALSMRQLAQKLKVEAMSLYNHVASKDEVLAGITDLVVGEIAVPKAGANWRREMKRRAVTMHHTLLKHRWASMLLVSRVNTGPNMLRFFDASLGCLVSGGFSYALADQALNAIDSHVYGFTLQSLSFPFQPDEYAAAATEHLALIPPATHPHLNALSQLVISGKGHGANELEFGLQLILEGLERRL